MLNTGFLFCRVLMNKCKKMKKIGTVNFYLYNDHNQNLCFYKKIHFLLNYYKY